MAELAAITVAGLGLLAVIILTFHWLETDAQDPPRLEPSDVVLQQTASSPFAAEAAADQDPMPPRYRRRRGWRRVLVRAAEWVGVALAVAAVLAAVLVAAGAG